LSRLYLLDTNILSELVRNPFGMIRQRVDHVGSDNVFTSMVVAGELHFGTVKKMSPALRIRVLSAFDFIPVWALPIHAYELYGNLRADLEQRGLPISANDMWIAAHALAEDAVLVSNNIREFSRVPGLKVENWMQAS
jgi:tRNA(fMet)-specific endonuclease VapC